MNKNLIVTIIISALIGGISGVSGSYVFTSTNRSSPQSKEVIKVETDSNLYIQAIDKVSPSVVSIIASKELNNYYSGRTYMFFPGSPFKFKIPTDEKPSTDNSEKTKIGGGSGFIITEDGLVVSNRHVVDDNEADYTVITSDQKTYYAKIVSKDNFNDLAVLQLYTDEERSIKAKALTPVELGDSDGLKIGSQVIAIGNALSEFDNTTTAGIISGKGREITANTGNGSSEKLTGLLQTDAAINPGNSGGPLINLAGQVIGINTAIAAQANGIGFAIPINLLKPALESVEKFGKIVRPYLGVRYSELNPELAKSLELSVEYGAYIADDIVTGTKAVLKDSPAHKAGLKNGDIITEVNKEKISKTQSLSNLIQKYKVGDTVDLYVLRDSKNIILKVKLEEAK